MEIAVARVGKVVKSDSIKLTHKQLKHLSNILETLDSCSGSRIADVLCEQDFKLVQSLQKKVVASINKIES